MADSIGSVVQGAHSGFYVYWAKHLGIDKEAFYLSERKNTASVSSSDICLDTSTVVGYEEIGSRTGPSLNTVVKSTLLGGTGLGLLASSVSNNEEASFVVFLKDGESCTVHLDITWAVQYFRRIFVTKKGAGPNGSSMQQGGVARVSGDPKVLLERAFMFLEDGDWAKADIYCESVLDQEPKCAEAYLGKLMAEVKVRKKEDLSKAKEPLDQSDSYTKVMRFADEGIRESLSKAKELQHNEQRYMEAVACMAAASDEDAYRSASQKFLLLGSYKDSSSRREQCIQRADRIIADRRQREEIKRKEDIYSRAEKCMRLGTVEGCNSAIRLYESIPGYRSSAAQISECRRKIEEIKAKEAARQVAVEKAKKKAKKIAIIAAPIVCVCIAFVIVLTTFIIPNNKYNAAIELMDNKEYEEAIASFEALDGYKDSADKIAECKTAISDNDYNTAIGLMSGGKYEEAIAAFEALDGYKDSTDKIAECKTVINDNDYNAAVELMSNGKYEDAVAAFEALGGYKDSPNKAIKCYAQYMAEKLETAKTGDYVTFGSYEQDNNTSNGKEDIEWLVLAKEGDKTLLISRYALDCQQYDISRNSTWDTCSLCRWLNITFTSNAFSLVEQGVIQNTTVTADRNPKYSTTDPGNATDNKVFLLSINEVERYFSSDSERACKPTEYAVANGAEAKRYSGTCSWWLRSPGEDGNRSTEVNQDGRVNYYGYYVQNDDYGVRPAMWISLK